MTQIFISHPWGPSCPAYAGGKRIEVENVSSMDCGATSNSCQFSSGNHIGTHVDFPRHFDRSGRTATDYEPSDFFFSSIALFWLSIAPGALLTPEHLARYEPSFTHSKDVSMVLIRMGAGLYRQEEAFWRNGPGLGEGTADWLRRKFPLLRAVGVDSISISSLVHREVGRVVHREYLACSRPLLLFEDMNLEPLQSQSPSSVIALPLRIEEGDGAPCTVVAHMGRLPSKI